jgi:hypothetical protein
MSHTHSSNATVVGAGACVMEVYISLSPHSNPI